MLIVANNSMKKNLFIIIIYMMTFNNGIIGFGFWDEAIAIFLFGAMFISFLRKRYITINKGIALAILMILVLLFAGIYSNCKYKYQAFSAVLYDIFITLKFFGALFGAMEIYKRFDVKQYSRSIVFHTKVCINILFFLTILNLCFGTGDNKLFYEHQTYFVAAVVFLLVIITCFLEDGKSKVLYMLLCLLMIATAEVTKGYMCIAMYIIVYWMFVKNNFQFKIWYGVLVMVIMGIVAWKDFSYYFLSNSLESARYALLMTSIRIAKDYFPFGTGFATFGSFYSGREAYYSPIYEMYGINTVYGLVRGNAMFVADNFWPMILGQFGIIGIASYIIALGVIMKKIFHLKSINRCFFAASFIAFAYLLISSTAEAGFNSSFATTYAIIIGMSLGKSEDIAY